MSTGTYSSGYRSGYRSRYVSGFPAGSGGPPAPAPPLAGLVAWWRGDMGVTRVGANATGWADQSGNGHNLVNAVDPITYVASAINGKPGFRFDSTGNQAWHIASNLLTPGHARTVTVVCQAVAGAGVFNAGGCAAIFESSAGTSWVMYLGLLGGTTYGYGTGSANDTMTSPPAITNLAMIARLSGTGGSQPKYVINGADTVLTAGNVATESGTDGFNIGSYLSASQDFQGPICEVFVHDHELTAPEQAQMDAYLAPIYGITL